MFNNAYTALGRTPPTKLASRSGTLDAGAVVLVPISAELAVVSSIQSLFPLWSRWPRESIGPGEQRFLRGPRVASSLKLKQPEIVQMYPAV